MAIETVTGETREAFMNERLRITPEPEAKPEPENKPEPEVKAAAEEVVEEPKPDEAKVEDKPEPKDKKAKLSERFSELTDKARKAVERAEAAERERDELKAKLTPPEPAKAEPKSTKPDPKDFTDAFEYAEKLAAWTTEQALQRRDKEASDKATNEQRSKVVTAWKEHAAAAKAELPDYDDVLASSTVAVHDEVRDAIMESEHGPRLLYEIASDDELSKKMAMGGMSVRAQLLLLGRLSTKFDKQETKPEESEAEEKPKPRPKAPAPITAVKGGRSADNPLAQPGEFSGTFAEYKAARLAQQRH